MRTTYHLLLSLMGGLLAQVANADNIVYYKTNDGQIITPCISEPFGSGISIVSNEIVDDQGVIILSDVPTDVMIDAFRYCSNLTSITLPEGIGFIHTSAFQECYNLKRVSLPSTTNYVSAGAFMNADNMDVFCYATVVPYSLFNTFYNASTCKLHVPAESLKGYASSPNWSEFGLLYDLEGHQYNKWWDYLEAMTETTESNVIYYRTVDEEELYPREGASFGANLISNTYNNGIGRLTFDGPVTQIGSYAFSSGQTNEAGNRLMRISLPTSVQAIEDHAFDYCINLRTISVPEGVTSVGSYSFAHCIGMDFMILPSTIEHIGAGMIWRSYVNSLFCKASTPPACDSLLCQEDEYLTVYVKENDWNTYYQDSIWQNYSLCGYWYYEGQSDPEYADYKICLEQTGDNWRDPWANDGVENGTSFAWVAPTGEEVNLVKCHYETNYGDVFDFYIADRNIGASAPEDMGDYFYYTEVNDELVKELWGEEFQLLGNEKELLYYQPFSDFTELNGKNGAYFANVFIPQTYRMDEYKPGEENHRYAGEILTGDHNSIGWEWYESSEDEEASFDQFIWGPQYSNNCPIRAICYELPASVEKPTGIKEAHDGSSFATTIYDVAGRRQKEVKAGINIVKGKNGKASKIVKPGLR